VCRPKHVEQLRNIGIINSITRLHLVGSFYEIYITMHGSMNIRFTLGVFNEDSDKSYAEHIRFDLQVRGKGNIGLHKGNKEN